VEALPACPWPGNVIFVDALHGGLLGDGPADLGRGRRLADAPASAGLPFLSMPVVSLLRCRL
jgi:hypothetical protein